jgi:hypothetical protein
MNILLQFPTGMPRFRFPPVVLWVNWPIKRNSWLNSVTPDEIALLNKYGLERPSMKFLYREPYIKATDAVSPRPIKFAVWKDI